jgi:flagellar basal body rod protein FlgB
MKMSALNPLDKAVKILDVLTTKQELIADNITNMDTPGYVRKDIKFSNYLNSSGSSLEAKLDEKLGPGLIAMEASGPVDPAQEIANMQQNYVLYSMATRKMKSTITELRTVIDVGGM